MRNQKIAILGAGIGGLTTAIALSQKGFNNITLYDRMHSPLEGGAGLVLWPNATCILNNLGINSEIKEIGGDISSMIRWSSEGELLGKLSIKDLEKTIGYSSYPVTRHGLQRVLMDKLKSRDVNISYAKNAERIYLAENNNACIEFSDQETVTPDIIVGADGRMRSVARKFVAGSNTPIYQDYVNWVGLIENTPIDINKSMSIHDYWGIGERFGYVPIKKNKSYWAGCKKLPVGLGEPRNGNKAELTSIFKNWPDPIQEIISNTRENNIRRIEVFDHNPIERWHLNNVCLLGDAAHAALPTSGQGACQAIEDAWHFAECLEKGGNDLEQSFVQFERSRYQKTKSIILGARGFAESLFSEDPAYCKTRNENAKKSSSRAQIEGMSNLWHSNLP